MHKTKVLILGSKNFNTSLEELKDHLNFRLSTTNNELNFDLIRGFDILIFHQDYFKNKKLIDLLKKIQPIKVLFYNTSEIAKKHFDACISLPINIQNLSVVIENLIIKKNFNKNSSIKIKNYILDKNEKKLKKNNIHVLLTEKEIQLLMLFLSSKKAVSKNKILEEVWRYSSEADTHTVETHIYRLRKKIKSNFLDDSFIINNKHGYQL